MKLFYEEAANKPGIYKILNTHTDRIYIGQAQNFKKRWFDHQRSLKNGNHQNRFLCNDFAKCFQELNHDNFIEFYVLEIMEGSTKEERDSREEWYIAQFYDRQDRCYNFKQKSASKQRSCYSNTPEETHKLISENSKKLWKNSEHKKLMSKLSKERWENPEYKEMMCEKISKALTGNQKNIEHLNEIRKLIPKGKEHPLYGRENKWGTHTPEAKEKIRKAGLGRKKSAETIAKQSGENHWSKRMSFSEETKKKMSNSHKKIPVKLTNLITGEIKLFEGINIAAKELGLFRSGIRAVLKGKNKHTKNWTCEYA